MHHLQLPSGWRSAPHALYVQWAAEETALQLPAMKQRWRSAAAAAAAAAAAGENLQTPAVKTLIDECTFVSICVLQQT